MTHFLRALGGRAGEGRWRLAIPSAAAAHRYYLILWAEQQYEGSQGGEAVGVGSRVSLILHSKNAPSEEIDRSPCFEGSV